MEKNLTYSYNDKSDELNICFGKPKENILLEVGDEYYLKLDPKTREVCGITVLHLSERAKKYGKEHVYSLPLNGYFTPATNFKKLISAG